MEVFEDGCYRVGDAGEVGAKVVDRVGEDREEAFFMFSPLSVLISPDAF